MQPPTGPSDVARLRLRAVQAIALQVGFYLFGIGTGLALFAIPIAEIRLNNRLSLSGIISAAIALWLAWALLPPIIRFRAPGPRLLPENNPRMYELIENVAAKIGVRAPRVVYLVQEANAFIGVRRGWTGRGTFLGIGLPLLHGLTLGELRSVLAHELGHQHKGDLRLGPWVYGTMQAIARSLARLDEDGIGFHLLFRWYGLLYARVSQDVSRRQELHADAVSGFVCGREVAINALHRIEELAFAWGAYWREHGLPVLETGNRPPILEGFDHFRLMPDVRQAVERTKTEDAKLADPYDSHPTLAKRYTALEVAPDISADPDDAQPASVLLPDMERAEQALVRFMAVGNKDFPVIAWGDVPHQVWLPRWREYTAPFQEALSQVKPSELGIAMGDLNGWAKRLRGDGPATLSPEANRRRAASLLTFWLCLLLDQRGWLVEGLPGEPLRFRNNGLSIEPFTLLEDIREGRLSAEEWENTCSNLGL